MRTSLTIDSDMDELTVPALYGIAQTVLDLLRVELIRRHEQQAYREVRAVQIFLRQSAAERLVK